jgi:hypothetical protein
MKRNIMGVLACIIASAGLLNIMGCGDKNLDKLSPKEVTELYLKARKNGNIETLRKIVYMPPETTVKERERWKKSMIVCDDEKMTKKIVFSIQKVEYEKIIDKDTAEVGVILFVDVGPGLRTPLQQMMLKKDSGIWKIHCSKLFLNNEEQLRKIINKNPSDADAYYYLAMMVQHKNPAKAKRYFRKYYELAPDGFWIDSNMKEQFKGVDGYKKEEQSLLEKLKKLPLAANKNTIYRNLGQIVIEGGDYEKAEVYFQKAEDELKKKNSYIGAERLKQARQELERLIKLENDKNKAPLIINH